MTTMREKIAEAMAAKLGDDWQTPNMFVLEYGDNHETCRAVYREMADAAIEAMREPTPAMLVATEEVVTGFDDFACGDGTLYLSYPGFHDYARNAWAAMIDAALSEKEST